MTQCRCFIINRKKDSCSCDKTFENGDQKPIFGGRQWHHLFLQRACPRIT